MRLETWQGIGIVCGAILAVAGVLVLVARGLRGMWRMARKLTELLEQLKTLNERLETHLEWHADPGGNPATPGRPPRSNSAGTQRQPPRR